MNINLNFISKALFHTSATKNIHLGAIKTDFIAIENMCWLIVNNVLINFTDNFEEAFQHNF